MTPRPRVRALLVAVALLAVTACAPRVVGEITDMSPVVDVVAPRFVLDPRETRIERFDPPGAGAGLVVDLSVVVSNPNAFDLFLETVDYRLLLAGERAHVAVLEPHLSVPALGSARWRWRLEASLADQPRLWRAVVASFAGEPLPFAVEGRLRFRSEVFIFSTGVRPLFSGVLRARQAVEPPVIGVVAGTEGTVVARADAPALRFLLELHNPGDVGYFVSARGLALGLLAPGFDASGTPLAPTDAERARASTVAVLDLAPVPLPAGATVRREIVVVLDLERLAADDRERVEALLAGGPTRFVLDGTFVYDVLGADSFQAPGRCAVGGLRPLTSAGVGCRPCSVSSSPTPSPWAPRGSTTPSWRTEPASRGPSSSRWRRVTTRSSPARARRWTRASSRPPGRASRWSAVAA